MHNGQMDYGQLGKLLNGFVIIYYRGMFMLWVYYMHRFNISSVMNTQIKELLFSVVVHVNCTTFLHKLSDIHLFLEQSDATVRVVT